MRRRPEQRAAKIQRDYLLTGEVERRIVRDITRAIRRAENDLIDDIVCVIRHANGGDYLGPWTRALVERIEAMKTATPRKDAKP